MRRSTILLATLLAVMVGPVPAAAQQPAMPVYLALGDSLAAGVGASDPSATGYVARLHDELATRNPCGRAGAWRCRLQLRNLAVPGATTGSLIDEQLPEAVALLAKRNGDRIPVNDVAYVTVDIGGNDAFGVLDVCRADKSDACRAAIASMLQTVAVNTHHILGSLRAAAGPDTPIAIMTYYNPLPACHLSEFAPLADLVLEGGPGLEAGLNDVLRAVAAPHDVRVAETYGRVGLEDLVGGMDCLHPNDAGHAVLADAYADVIEPAVFQAWPAVHFEVTVA